MDTTLSSVMEVLGNAEVSALDSARFVRNILDAKPSDSKLTDAQFILKVIEVGLRHFRTKEMSFKDGFNLYYETKKDILRPDSLRDIRYLANRLMRSNSQLANRNFSELSRTYCEDWLNNTFSTPSQYNKGRSFLHAIFEFAIRREWCDKNPIKCIERKRIIEREIIPLSIDEIKKILENAGKIDGVLAPVALMIFAGIRPREIRRLCWRDIDLSENTIKIRGICSKTGGVRHVENFPALKRYLVLQQPEEKICPKNWQTKWRKIRDTSGFCGIWVQDVLRHTYASYFVKRYSDLSRLQTNMGHTNISLLRSRYVNLFSISNASAKNFFN